MSETVTFLKFAAITLDLDFVLLRNIFFRYPIHKHSPGIQNINYRILKTLQTDMSRLASNIRLGLMACNYAIQVAPISATRTRAKRDWFLTLSMRAEESSERESVKQALNIENKTIRNRRLDNMIQNQRIYSAATRINPMLGQIEGQRARLAKNAKEFSCGNCGERSALCVDYLFQNRPKNTVHHIAWCSLATSYKTILTPKGGDHQFCLYDTSNSPDPVDFETWGPYAIIVDGWTNDVYPVVELGNWKLLGVLTPRKWLTRRLINMYAGHIMLDEFIP